MSFENIEWSKCSYHIVLTYDQVHLLYNALRIYYAYELRLSEFLKDGENSFCDKVMELLELVQNAIYVTEPKKHHLDLNFDQYSLINYVLLYYSNFGPCAGVDHDEIESEKVKELIDIVFNCSYTPPSCAIDDDDQTTT